MTFFGSILLLVSICLVVALPYGVGHGLATHHSEPIIIGIVAGLLGVGLFALQKKMNRPDHHH